MAQVSDLFGAVAYCLRVSLSEQRILPRALRRSCLLPARGYSVLREEGDE